MLALHPFSIGAALYYIIFILRTTVAAPYNQDQPSGLEPYYADLSAGCYYNFQHYDEGDRIITNEPCLNCTCHNRMLMCYLRVCPFTKAIGQDCTVEKKPDQCCPVITCPEVPVQLLTATTTETPEMSTEVGHVDNYGCSIDDVFYSDGAQVPSNPHKPCELCYCIRNRTACVMQECTLHVEGCKPVHQEGICCPVRYDCDYEEESLETTVRPTPGLVITTTLQPGESLDCYHNNEIYSDGALISTEKPCEHCYCMKGEIVCAVQECGTPMQHVGKNCTAIPPKPGQCCPDTYECATESAIDLTTTEPVQTTLFKELHEDITKMTEAEEHVQVTSEEHKLEHTTTEIPLQEQTTKQAAVTKGESNIHAEPDKSYREQITEMPMFSEVQTTANEPQTVQPILSIENEINATSTPETETESNKQVTVHTDISELPVKGQKIIPEHEIIKPEEEIKTTTLSYKTSSIYYTDDKHTTVPETDVSKLQEPETEGTPSEVQSHVTEKGPEEHDTTISEDVTQKQELVTMMPEQHTSKPLEETVVSSTEIIDHEIKTHDFTTTENIEKITEHISVTSEESRLTDVEHKDYSQLTTEAGEQKLETSVTTDKPELHSFETTLADKLIPTVQSPQSTEKIPDQGTIQESEKPELVTAKEKISTVTEDHLEISTSSLEIEKETKPPKVVITEKTDFITETITQHPEENIHLVTDEQNTIKIDTADHVMESTVPSLTTNIHTEQSMEETSELPHINKTQQSTTESQNIVTESHEISDQTTEQKSITLTDETLQQVTEAQLTFTEKAPEIENKINVVEENGEHTTKLIPSELEVTSIPTQIIDLATEKSTPTELIPVEPIILTTEQELIKTTPKIEEGNLDVTTTKEIEEKQIVTTEKVEAYTENITEGEILTSSYITEKPEKQHSTKLHTEEPSTTEALHEEQHPIDHILKEPHITCESDTELCNLPEKHPPTIEEKVETIPEEPQIACQPESGLCQIPEKQIPVQETTEEHYQDKHPVDNITDQQQPTDKISDQQPVESKPKIKPPFAVTTEKQHPISEEQPLVTEQSSTQITPEEQPLTEKLPSEQNLINETTEEKFPALVDEVLQITTTQQSEIITTISDSTQTIKSTNAVTEQILPGSDTFTEQIKEEPVTQYPLSEDKQVTERLTTLFEEILKSQETTSNPTTESFVPEISIKINDVITEAAPEKPHVTELITTKSTDEQITEKLTQESESKPPETVTELIEQTTQNINAITTEKLIIDEAHQPEIKPEEQTQKPITEFSKPLEEITQEYEQSTILVTSTHLPIVPGEGSCLVEGQTYENNSLVPSMNPCQIACRCVSSIVQCESMSCLPAPVNMQNCMPIYQSPHSCCPTYTCTGTKPTEIESDSQVFGTTTPEILLTEKHIEESTTAHPASTSEKTEIEPNISTEAPQELTPKTIIYTTTSPTHIESTSPTQEIQVVVIQETQKPETVPEEEEKAVQHTTVVSPLEEEVTKQTTVSSVLSTSEENIKGISHHEISTQTSQPLEQVTQLDLEESSTTSEEHIKTTATIIEQEMSTESELHKHDDVSITTTLHPEIEKSDITHYEPISTPATSDKTTAEKQVTQNAQEEINTEEEQHITTEFSYKPTEIIPEGEQKYTTTEANLEQHLIETTVASLENRIQTEVHEDQTTISSLSSVEPQSTDFLPSQENKSEATTVLSLTTLENVSTILPIDKITTVASTMIVNPEVTEEVKQEIIHPEQRFPDITTVESNYPKEMTTLNPVTEYVTIRLDEKQEESTTESQEVKKEITHITHATPEHEGSFTEPSKLETKMTESSVQEITTLAQITTHPEVEVTSSNILHESESHITEHNEYTSTESVKTKPTIITEIPLVSEKEPESNELTKDVTDSSLESEQAKISESTSPLTEESTEHKIIEITTHEEHITEQPHEENEIQFTTSQQEIFTTENKLQNEVTEKIGVEILSSSEAPADVITPLNVSSEEPLSSTKHHGLTTRRPEVPEDENEIAPTEITPLITSSSEDTSSHLYTTAIPEITSQIPHIIEEVSTSSFAPSHESTEVPVTQASTTSHHHVPEDHVPEMPDYNASGDDYEDQQNTFGPGTCRYGGKIYVSAQQIPRDDPCDFCFCFRSDIICLQQSCPPPIPGCHEEPIPGFCCPRYECPVSMALALNVTTSTTTTTTTLPPHFFSHAYKGATYRQGCQIQGQAYQVGEVVRSASGPCLHCTCGGDGQMKCDPKACSPQPMLQQMIAAAATRR